MESHSDNSGTCGSRISNYCALLSEYELKPDEAAQLASLSASQVKLFSTSLRNKRFHQVRELLPLTFKALGNQFSSLFRIYAETNVPGGAKKHVADALAFTAYVEQAARTDESISQWSVELMRYEAAWLETVKTDFRFIARAFRYDVLALRQQIARDEELLLAKSRRTFFIPFRFNRCGQVRSWIWRLPTFRKWRVHSTATGTSAG